MFNIFKKNKSKEANLYNKILFLSRNKLFYTKYKLEDTFQNRINLIFIHVSFLFVKTKNNKKDKSFKDFYQSLFDYMISQIEINMREIGYGDVTVNKNMKYLVKIFYSILLNCENYNVNDDTNKKNLLYNHLTLSDKKNDKNNDLNLYFDAYEAFCLDLSLDKVLKGELNFNYK